MAIVNHNLNHSHNHNHRLDHAALPDEIHEGTLLHLLSNHLLLCHTAPYLPISAVLNLAATSRSFRALIRETPTVFRHLDLSHVQSAQFDIDPIDQGGETWRNVQLDENLTEDDFYSGPLRGIFSNLRRHHILRDVSTLVLDGLSVTAELVHDIITDPSFSVKILSLRDAKNLNERKLRGALETACRRSRPKGTPRLKALYIFGAKEPPMAVTTSPCGHAPAKNTGTIAAGWNQRSQEALTASLTKDEGDAWYVRRGKMVPRPISPDWAPTLLACAGVISFDAVLCRGPRHLNSPVFGKVNISGSTGPSPNPPSHWAVATHALDGCAGCGSAPEGWTIWGQADNEEDATSRYPLLAPPPLHSSNVRIASCPSGASIRPHLSTGSNKSMRFIPRCMECLRDRYCWGCHKWWCESCFVAGGVDEQDGGLYYKARITKSCWECGNNCNQCIEDTQRMCRSCRGGYCIIHNEGSTLSLCDWCSSRGRRIRDLD